MEKLPPEVSDRADAMDPELRRKIEERAYALWEADGRPEGQAWTTGFKRNGRSSAKSIAGEEDPLVGIDKDKTRHRQRQERSRA